MAQRNLKPLLYARRVEFLAVSRKWAIRGKSTDSERGTPDHHRVASRLFHQTLGVSGSATSPLPMTGMLTASFTRRMMSQSARPEYNCFAVRPCTATACAPASCTASATSTALT